MSISDPEDEAALRAKYGSIACDGARVQRVNPDGTLSLIAKSATIERSLTTNGSYLAWNLQCRIAAEEPGRHITVLDTATLAQRTIRVADKGVLPPAELAFGPDGRLTVGTRYSEPLTVDPARDTTVDYDQA